jgi:dipeptidyl aminopeptidase/acylaminoacyl peptidase
LFDADSAAVFAPPEYLLFARQGALMAQRWDWTRLELSGDPSSLAGLVLLDIPGYFSVALSASSVGPLAYRPGAGERQLVWLDRSGRQIGTVSGPDMAAPDEIRLSPDGRTVALTRIVGGNRDVWLIETVRGTLRRFTFDAGRDVEPIWSPDGSRIVFAETLLFASSEFKNVFDESADGRFILYTSQTPKAGRDLWALPLFGERKPFLVAQTPLDEAEGRFSPDSRWIAYQSNESGRNEIYVQPFPGSGGRSQVSTDGGTNAQWRRDGRELFYLGLDNRLMAVRVTVNRSSVEAGTPVALFSMPPGSQYAAAPDGERFLVNMITADPSPVTILLNWTAGLKN